MSMQIRSIVLYSHRGQRREIDFNLGQVNIITGDKNTGKSAIIHIVEYCMGRPDFGLVDDIIRRYVAVFGVLFQVNNTQVFVAKPAPEENKTKQSKAYIQQGDSIEIPRHSAMRFNLSDSDIHAVLSRLIRTTALNSVVVESQTLESLKTSVEYAVYYLFQRSNEIVNPEMLFHRQQDSGIPQIIKDTLPYFLGVIQESDILDRRELERVQGERRAVLLKLRTAEAQRDRRVEEKKHLLEQAQEVGLVKRDLVMQLDDQAAHTALVQTQEWTPDIVPPIQDDRIPRLQEQYNRVEIQFRQIHQEIAATEAHIREAEGYSREAHEQIMRLESINVFSSPDDLLSNFCPLCSSPLNQRVPQVSLIQESLSRLSNNLQYVEREQPDLRQYAESLREQREQLRDQMVSIKSQMRDVANEYSQQRDALQQSTIITAQISTVKGMIKQFLQSLSADEDANSLLVQLTEVNRRIEELKGKIAEDDKEDTLESVLYDLSGQMTEWAKILELSYEGFYRLDLKKLTVIVQQGRQVVPMKQMAGSQNPLGCHLIAHLALHQHFIRQKRPVPSFLILDQPAQGYFPSKAAYEALSNSRGAESDITLVTRMFDFLIMVCASLSPDFQIIVLEHAELDDENFRSACRNSRWTSDNALVPKEWISEEEKFQQISIDG